MKVIKISLCFYILLTNCKIEENMNKNKGKQESFNLAIVNNVNVNKGNHF